MKKLKGTFVIPHGYLDGSYILSDQALENIANRFKKGKTNIYWRGLDIAAAKDGEFIDKKFVVGELLDMEVAVQKVTKEKSLRILIFLDNEVVRLISQKKVMFDPMFTIHKFDKIGNIKVVSDASIERIVIRNVVNKK